MLTPVNTTRFKKDIKKALKQQKDMGKLKAVITLIINESPLPPKLKNHQLTGNYDNCEECHISPDWLLVYQIIGNEVFFIRIGSHSELF